MASTAMVQILADTSRFDDDLRSELTRIIDRIERQLPPVTIRVRLDDSSLQNVINQLNTINPDPVTVTVNADTRKPLKSISDLIAKISLVGPAVVQAGVAGVAALAGLGAAFVTAGAAVGAFTAAAKPQLAEVTEVTKLYEDAQKAAATGAEDAAKKQAEYETALKNLQPATRDTAKAFIGLREDFKSWSDSLASTTMPIFTKGIELLRSLLPELTPLVKAAAKQFGKLLDRMQEGVDSGGFAKFIDAVVKASETTLPSLIRSFGNIITGLVGIGKAFGPVTDGVTGNFEEMTKKFAEWGESLSTNTAFQEFIENFKGGGDEIGETLGNLGQIFVNLAVALAPFTGILLAVVAAFTQFLAILPPPVVTALAVAFTTWAVAIRLYATYVAIASAATAAWAVIQTGFALAMTLGLGPIIALVAGVLALIAVIVLIATKTTWFQDIWKAVWGFIKEFSIKVWDAIKLAFTTVWNAIKTAAATTWEAIKQTAITIWNAIKTAILTVWNGIKTGISTTLGAIKLALTTAWNTVKTSASTAWNAIKKTILDIFNKVWTGIKETIKKITDGVKGIKKRITGFFENAGRWLYNSGRAIIKGLIDGIKSKAADAYESVKGIVGKVRNLLPFSPAKEGPFSGRGYTTYSGAALMEGFLQGMEKAAPSVHAGLSKVLDSLPSFTPTASLAGVDRTTQTEGMRLARGDFQKRALNFRGDQQTNVTVMIGNQVVDQYVEARIQKNNQARDRRSYQGSRY